MRVSGTVTIHPRGFGFLNFAPGQSAFIAPPDLNAFLSDDLVEAEIRPKTMGNQESWEAKQLVLQSRPRSTVFGSLVFHGRQAYLKLDRLVANTDLPLAGSSPSAEAGSHWLGSLVEGKVHLLRQVPAEEVALERLLARHCLRSQPLNGPSSTSEPNTQGRRDLRHLTTITIDAPSTRDIDDALAILPADSDGALRVLVSIADVDSQVPQGSETDLEARLRGTSCYLAGRVIPMLPESLSYEALSLVPQQDRLTLTVEMRLDCEGQITAVDLYESVIRSSQRLSYQEVSEFLEGKSADLAPEICDTLRRLRAAAARLSAVRAARGGVELGGQEAYVSFDPETRQPSAVHARQDTPAHRMVERLMVAANEAVAQWLVARGLPGLFRVHPEPEPSALESLAASAARLGFEAAFGKRLTPRGLAAFEAQYRGTLLAPAMAIVLGQALGQARYTAEAGSHFGLGAPLYLHFTSPIRRYADLMVHRIIKGYLAGQRESGPARASELEALAEHLNGQGRRAARAEREFLALLAAGVFRQRIGEKLAGHVVAQKPWGWLVALQGLGLTAGLAKEEVPAAQALELGQSLLVEVVGVQEELGRIELSFQSLGGS